MIQARPHPDHLVFRGMSVRQAIGLRDALARRHYGPGAHPGTGTEQTVHNPHAGFSHETAPAKGESKEARQGKLERLAHQPLGEFPQETQDEARRIQEAYAFDLKGSEVQPVAVYSTTHRMLREMLAKQGLSESESNKRATEVLAEAQPELHKQATETLQTWNTWQANYEKAVRQAEEQGLKDYQVSIYTGQVFPKYKKDGK